MFEDKDILWYGISKRFVKNLKLKVLRLAFYRPKGMLLKL